MYSPEDEAAARARADLHALVRIALAAPTRSQPGQCCLQVDVVNPWRSPDGLSRGDRIALWVDSCWRGQRSVELNDGDERQDLGVIVDAVNEVLEIPGAEIAPPPTFGAKIRADFIQGMGKVEGRFVIILNGDRVLSTEEITMLASMSGNGSGNGNDE